MSFRSLSAERGLMLAVEVLGLSASPSAWRTGLRAKEKGFAGSAV